MFEGIFSRMTNEERARYNTSKILLKLRLKLAVAYLIARKRKGFWMSLKRLGAAAPLAYLMGPALLAIPPSALGYLWLRNQRSGYEEV